MPTTALSKAEQNALSVSYDVLGTRVELDLQFVKKYLVRGKADLVSDQELVLFMSTCRQLGLNPLVQGEAFLIKWSADDPATIQVGKNAYLRKAFEHPSYLTRQDGITVRRGNEIVQKEGSCLYPGEELLGGWCKVYFDRGGKERVAFKEVALSEYNRGMANWKSKPATMINKVAVSQCVRDAFPKEYEGIYSEEELLASGVIPVEYPDNLEIIDDDPAITQEQRQQMLSAARSRFGDGWKGFIIQASSAFGLTSTADMRVSAWSEIMSQILSAPAEPDDAPEDDDGEQLHLPE